MRPQLAGTLEKMVSRATAALLLLVSGARCAFSADLKPATVEAFDRYIGQVEQRLSARKVFLWPMNRRSAGRGSTMARWWWNPAARTLSWK